MRPVQYSLYQVCSVKSNRPDHNQIEAQIVAHPFFRGLKAILREAVALGNATTRAFCSPFNFHCRCPLYESFHREFVG